MQMQRTSHARATRRASIYSVVLLPLFAALAAAQPMQSAAAPVDSTASTAPATPTASAAPNSTSFDTLLERFIPALPLSVVPPRLEAPYPCQFPHSAVYAHPTGPTIVTFTITARGSVTNAAVVMSSGSNVVDEAVRNCVSSFIYAPAIRDGQPIDVTWAYGYTLTVSNSYGTHAPPGLPPDAPQGTKLVMMPVAKYRSSVGSCENWHGDAAHSVLVAFDVEPDGSVKNASVARSSGDAAIDKDAVDCVSRRDYKPATSDGQPIEIRVTSELFGLKRD